MIFWLKNRQPDKWRDKKENEITGDITEYFKLIADAIDRVDTNTNQSKK